MSRWFWPGTLVLLAILGTVQIVTALGETQTWDEGIHIAAGYAYLKHGDYGWNNEHPPLVKIVSALPLLPLKPVYPVNNRPWAERDQVRVGFDFLYRNVVPADLLLFRARLTTIALTLAGGLLLALWTRRRFGPAAALMALAFYVFDPNLIAHGRYVTTDVPMAVFFFLTVAAWTEYLISNRKRDLGLAALCFALAMVVKFSALLLLPVVGVLYAVRWAQKPREFGLRRLGLDAAVLVLATGTIVAVAYWRETVRALDPGTPALASLVDRSTATGAVLHRAGRWLHLPRHAFFTGLDSVAIHNKSGHNTYLLGQRSQTGRWFYFPVVFAVKSTMAAILATLVLIAAGVRRAMRGRWRDVPLEWIAVAVPPLIWFAAAMSSGINLGVRHILPVYPLLYVAAAAFLSSLLRRPGLRYAALALVGLQAVECASIYPDYLAFFNLPSGGPGNGPRYLVDSNIDWGQDVKKLAKWLEAHGTNKVWVSYFGTADLRYHGIDEQSLPHRWETEAWKGIDGFAAISVTQLQGVYSDWEDLEPVRRLPIFAKVGYSIYIYDMRQKR
jgi:hypothetical protein